MFFFCMPVVTENNNEIAEFNFLLIYFFIFIFKLNLENEFFIFLLFCCFF
jgi:hypothetical protein